MGIGPLSKKVLYNFHPLNIQQIFKGKRILFVFCSLNFGGAERQGMHLARYLNQRDADVQVLSTLPGHGPVADMCEAAGIPWTVSRFLWPCRKSSLLRDTWRLLQVLRKLQPHVILAYTPRPNVGCGLVGRWSKSNFIWGERNVCQVRGDSVGEPCLASRFSGDRQCQSMLDYFNNNLAPLLLHIHIFTTV